MGGALEGLTVVDVSTTPPGAHVSHLFADFGADVVCIEPPGGSPLRALPAWPFWARGKRSIVLDLADGDDAATARLLAARADVFVETWRPGVADRLGLGYDELSALNPGLVHTSITAFGRNNRWSHLKGYEPIAFAKIGALDAFSSLSDRPGPSYVATPYCSFTASQLALHGTLAALYERERSGVGQRVETTLAQGLLAHDTWNWILKTVVARFPEAFVTAPPTEQDMLVPHSALFFRLMVGLTADGRWLQFSQTTDRLWAAFMRTVGLDWMLDDPEWKDAPGDPDPHVRIAFWERALVAVREKSLDEWNAAFDPSPTCGPRSSATAPSCSITRRSRTTAAWRPSSTRSVARCSSPGRWSGWRRRRRSSAHLRRHSTSTARRSARLPPARPLVSTPVGRRATDAPPLAGVTVVELGSFYAAPFGATVLADLGARVIKVEQLDGDPIRHLMPFPEVGGVKVLQGKESVAVDYATDQGREIVLDLVRRADIVLESFRAGVAERHGYTADDLLAVNPDLVYLAAPGYGTEGPCGAKPAFAPTIGAGSGMAYRNVGGVDNVPQRADLELDEVKHYSMRLNTAAMGVAHADGFAAVGVGTAMLVGLLARRTRRARPGDAHVDAHHDGARAGRGHGGVRRPTAARYARCRALRVVGAVPAVRSCRRLGVPRRADRRRVACGRDGDRPRGRGRRRA